MAQTAWQKEWRFVDTGVNNGFLNMAVDEAILDVHLRGSCPPTLRVYRWNPPALSLGYFRDLETEIDTKRCSELGVDIVRRLTGGRAVLHDDELTYSVVTSEACGFPKSLAQSYMLLNEGLIAAYRMLGVEACLEVHAGEPSSAACFSSAGLADLTFRGRKLCGSAQFRRGSALLQHGSLPIRMDPRALFSLLRFPSDADRDKAQADFRQKTVSLGEILNKIGWQELKEALVKGFQTALGIELCEGPLTPEELDLADKLAREKYKAPGWESHGRYET
jgi:lipoyl(octanoyl) transferase